MFANYETEELMHKCWKYSTKRIRKNEIINYYKQNKKRIDLNATNGVYRSYVLLTAFMAMDYKLWKFFVEEGSTVSYLLDDFKNDPITPSNIFTYNIYKQFIKKNKIKNNSKEEAINILVDFAIENTDLENLL